MQSPGAQRGPVGILLCAGFGRRFGGDKLLAPLADGTPVAVASARTLVAALGQAVAVVRPEQDALQARLAETGIGLLVCPEAEGGMGAALAAAVQRQGPASGWVVALGDMPCVAELTIRQVAGALAGGASLAAPFHQGVRGHPVGFAPAWRSALLSLTGDEGARALLRQHAAELTLIDVDDPGCLQDVDTPQDLVGLSRHGR
ncbi:nucleotidyltransferase family protein [Ideonella oryzae]|uniref:Nucleotidyltransferase family protein n=1 Tax=Ideonella oryzae TaxID=2937441 RepID=A0ABT1BHD9_9BURK|nr:nucleotidyltransferase family protein [Ideonella oryzae]MCO5975349.1 nucleotidyltransferase family protein [Ideonella oryzae]